MVYEDVFHYNMANSILQVPSNIILKRVAPSTWLAAIMFLWGVATVGQGLVQNQPGLIAMRLLLGLFEAGFFPGSVRDQRVNPKMMSETPSWLEPFAL
jgi:MFS family permease